MTKVIFCFAGTSNSGEELLKANEEFNAFKDDVIRIYFRGCHHGKVGGNSALPDLDIVSNKINNAFDKTTGRLDLNKLKQEMGSGIWNILGPQSPSNPQIESIGLQGFSRGAVTTFAVAKKLDHLGINMDIVADQPVPGPRIFHKYNDLTGCQHIRSAKTLLATHNLENGFFHNSFFQQMTTRFPEKTKAQTLLMPQQSHFSGGRVSLSHIGLQFIKQGYSTRKYNLEGTLKSAYRDNELYFTPKEFSQRIFSKDQEEIPRDPFYLDYIQNKAAGVLKTLNIPPVHLDDAQASAIAALGGQQKMPNARHINFIIENSEKAQHYVKIVNRAFEVTEYLSHVTGKHSSEKGRAISANAPAYLQAIFVNTFDYLQKENPSEQDNKHLANQLVQAQNQFAGRALSIERNIVRKAVGIITNLISHSVAMLTGKKLELLETRSERKVAKATKDVTQIATQTKSQEYKEQLQADKKTNSPEDKKTAIDESVSLAATYCR